MPGPRRLQFYQADVFTDEPFGGNPVAVFPDADGLTDVELQQIARERLAQAMRDLHAF